MCKGPYFTFNPVNSSYNWQIWTDSDRNRSVIGDTSKMLQFLNISGSNVYSSYFKKL
jgi:hypothetical protein